MKAPEELQRRLDASIAAIPSPVLQHVIDVSRKAGSDAFRSKKYAEAVKMYSQALAGAPKDATLLRNRSAAYSALGEHTLALQDASQALQLNSSWPKGFYRLGSVYMDIFEWKSAAEAFQRGLSLDPSNKELEQRSREATAEAEYQAKCLQAQLATERRGLVVDLRKARREEVRGNMERQYRQSMTAPDWDLNDYDWRPTFLPSSKLKPAKPYTKEKATYIALKVFVETLADLAHPKAALGLLHDSVRLGAFEDAIFAALDEQPGAHVLVLSQGTGILGLLTARAGAGRVSCFERSRMLFRMAKQAAKSNAAESWASKIHLYDRRLQAAGVQGEALPADVEAALLQLRTDAAHQEQNQAPSSRKHIQDGIGAEAAIPQIHSTGNSQLSSTEGTAAIGDSGECPQDGTGASTSACSTGATTVSILPESGDELLTEFAQENSVPKNEREDDLAVPASYRSDREGLAHHNGLGDRQEMLVADKVDSLARDRADNLASDLADNLANDQANNLAEAPSAGSKEDDELAAVQARIIAEAAMLPERAEILVTDLFDYSGLGMGLLNSLDYSASRLLKPGSRVVPAALKVMAMLVEMRITNVSGFDLSGLNRYRWHPGHEQIDLSRVQHKRLSQPFEALTLDLQRRVDDITFQRPASAESAVRGLWESQGSLAVTVAKAGICNAVVFWFQVNLHGDSWLTTWAGDDSGLPAAASWQQAAQYLDEFAVEKGSQVDLMVRQDLGQIYFSSPQAGRGRPRHAYIPRWHFDMVLDSQRNDAYEAAITKAVEFQHGMGAKEVHILDIGAGSGLLSLMAARAGADRVTGAEMSQHMADVAADAVVMNGFERQCLIVNKDVRRMDAVTKPDGPPPDLDRKADICVYEVFDSGLIGEGVLHLLHWARARLLQPHATLVPMAAVVWCQPLQMRIDHVKGLDMRQANRWQWRPDYQGIELAHCREQWVALGPPVEVMAFDFYESEANMQPVSTPVTAAITSDGVCNAVAFWFDLQLDENSQLSSSPYCDKGTTWQQAVQWMPETRVVANIPLRMLAKHDTYGISFELDETMAFAAFAASATSATSAASATPGKSSNLGDAPVEVPLNDPVWAETYEHTAAFNGQLAKVCIQSPLEFRTVSLAAIEFAGRPNNHNIDSAQAAEFCVRMMS